MRNGEIESTTPEYWKVFNGEAVSFNQIRQESRGMAIAFEQVVRSKKHHGQMTLDGDIIYPPLPTYDHKEKFSMRALQGNDVFISDHDAGVINVVNYDGNVVNQVVNHPQIGSEDPEGNSFLVGHRSPLRGGVSLDPGFHYEPE